MPHYPKPFFKKAKKSWYVEIDRKQIKLGPDRDLAFRRYHELMGQPKERQVASESLAALADVYLEWCHKHRSAETYEWYRSRLERFVRMYPTLRVDDLRPHHLQSWVDGMEGISNTTRRNYMRSVKRCMSWALRQGYVRVNPIAFLELPGTEARDVVVSDAEFEELLLHAGDNGFRDLLRVTRSTGCRPQESLRVEARHFDGANRRWIFPPKEAKGKRLPRVVYLTDEAFEITEQLAKTYPEGRLFRHSKGRAWTTDAVNCAFTRIQIRLGKKRLESEGVGVSDADIKEFMKSLKPTARRGGIEVKKTQAELRSEAKVKLTNRLAREKAPHFSLYALRHTWATKALENGLDALSVAVLMGHSDVSTLARTYQHLAHSPGHLLDQAKRAAARS